MRESRRIRALPSVDYNQESHEVDAEVEKAKDTTKDEIAKGYRLKDGRWRGEKFGDVEGVEVGTIFGAGDFQRQGRQEMSATGFFQPFVTPEWIHPDKGCFAIILNNDNGASFSPPNFRNSNLPHP